jgi:hypothetical protein
MKKNQAERDAAKLVNEKFGITDRKALPHERQGEWDAAYQTVLTEGVESKAKPTEKKDKKNTPSDYVPGTSYYGHAMLKAGLKAAQKKKVNEEALDEMMIKVDMDHKADHSRLEAKHNVKIVKPEDPKGKHVVQGSKENLRKFADNVYDNYSPKNIHPELYKDEKPLEEASLAGLAPPYKKTTKKDILVGRGVLKKHPTQPGKHVLAKKKQMEEAAGIQQPAPTATTNRPDRPSMGTQIGSTMRNSPVAGHAKQMMANQRAKQMQEGDTTSPSAMGINKPDYAPAGTTPDYAKSKEQTVNRAAKSSLPAGTVAKSIK